MENYGIIEVYIKKKYINRLDHEGNREKVAPTSISTTGTDAPETSAIIVIYFIFWPLFNQDIPIRIPREYWAAYKYIKTSKQYI